MRNLLFIALLTACSKSNITKTTETVAAPKVQLKRSAEISAHFIDHQPISAKASMDVEVDSLGTKEYTSDNFSFSVDAKGGTNFNKESVFYVGTFTKLSSLGSTPVSFGKMGGKTSLKSDKDYVLELLHYNLIKEAKKAGADALLGDVNYEWKVEETSTLQTRLFGLLPDKVINKKVTYTVQADCRTAKMVMNPYEKEESTVGGSAGADIKLNLDISTDGSASGSSAKASGGSTGGLLNKLK